MSTTIFTAYRLHAMADLWTVAGDIRKQGQAKVRAKLREIYEQHAGRLNSDTDEFRERLRRYGHEEMVRMALAREQVRAAYQAQVARSERNDYHFDVSVSFYQHEGRVYLIPYLDYPMAGVLDFLAADERLQDYAYWNSSDSQLQHMTKTEWEQRGEVWRAIFRGCNPVTLRLDICSWELFYFVDPEREIAAELKAKYRGREVVTG